MNCQDMEKFIHVYLDREFAEDDRADFERHLAECATCRRLAAFEQRFKQQLRTGLGRPPLALDAREGLRRKIRATLENAPPLPASHPASRWALRLIPAAAAAALLLGLMLRPGGDTPLPHPEIAAPAGGPAPVAMELRDPRAVRDFYEGKLDFRVDPPRFTDRGTALVGARLEPSPSRRAAHLVYRQGDRRFSVVMFRPDARSFQGKTRRRIGGRPVYVARHEGRPAVTFTHGGLGYTITGDLSPAALDRLVRDVVDPLPFPSPDAPVDAIPAGAPGRP